MYQVCAFRNGRVVAVGSASTEHNANKRAAELAAKYPMSSIHVRKVS